MIMELCEVFFDPKICELSNIFLNGTLKEMMGNLKAECGSLFLFDPRTQELVLNNFYNPQSIIVKGLRRKIGEGISGKVICLRQPVLIKDIDRDARFSRNGFNHYRTGSFMSIPLFVSGRPFGLINVGDKSNNKPFSEKDLDFAVTLAKYSCRIIESLLYSSKIRLENELLSREKSLLEKYASVGKMASGIVHEISNPLDGVIRFANMLSDSIEQNSRAAGYLLGVKTGLARIRDITQNLLNFGCQFKSAPGRKEEMADVNKLLEESLAIFSHRTNGQVKVIRKFRKDLPRVKENGLQQVFINLIKNSLDALSDSGELEIQTGLRQDELFIRIKDNGYGILPEVREHIFEPFFTTKGVKEGAGLGLSICKEIVDGHNGKITVQSKPGKGAEFCVFIPIGKNRENLIAQETGDDRR
jgi:signal transduction histidine kinase